MNKIMVLAAIGLFLGLAVTPSMNALVNKIYPVHRKIVALTNNGYGVELSCDNPYHSVPSEPGATTTFIVEITNTGTLDDTYDVTASSIEDINCFVNSVPAYFTPYPITLAAGESTTFMVTAQIWEGGAPIGKWGVIVEAQSQNDTTVYDQLNLTVNVLISGSDITIILPKGLNTFGFTIENTGTVTLTNISWTVTIISKWGLFSHDISGTMFDFELESGKTLNIPLILIALGPVTFNVTINTDQVSETASTHAWCLGLIAYFY